mmetsp:Transcript_597/g.600  ORF Transcript_597/g.600 Transcript_597/m.600 type:complete len:240 (+) Transcript_597:346-1065(+)
MFGNSARKKRQQKRNSAKRGIPAQNSTVAAVQELQKRIVTLEKRHKFLELKSNNLKQKAKQDVVNKDKSAALHKLQQKKIIDKESSTLAASILKLQEQISEIQLTATTGDIVDAMRLGADVQRGLQEKLDVDSIEDLLAEIDDMKIDNEEVTDLLGADYRQTDADVEREFELLMAEDVEENMNVAALPTPVMKSATADDDAAFEALLAGLQDAPTHKPAAAAQTSAPDAELEALAADFL